MASLEVDLSAIEPGNTITVKWRGKPVFVKHRTEEEISKAKDEDISKLRDPETDDARTQRPEVTQLLRLSMLHMLTWQLAVAGYISLCAACTYITLLDCKWVCNLPCILKVGTDSLQIQLIGFAAACFMSIVCFS